MSELQRFGVSMPQALLEGFDREIAAQGYANRSEALRALVRDYLVARQWDDAEAEVVGVITLVYDHHAYRLGETLTDHQHEQHEVVRCATHVHLDAHHCVEVIVVQGQGGQVQALADRLIALRGVKHGSLTRTATGAGLD